MLLPRIKTESNPDNSYRGNISGAGHHVARLLKARRSKSLSCMPTTFPPLRSDNGNNNGSGGTFNYSSTRQRRSMSVSCLPTVTSNSSSKSSIINKSASASNIIHRRRSLPVLSRSRSYKDTHDSNVISQLNSNNNDLYDDVSNKSMGRIKSKIIANKKLCDYTAKFQLLQDEFNAESEEVRHLIHAVRKRKSFRIKAWKAKVITATQVLQSFIRRYLNKKLDSKTKCVITIQKIWRGKRDRVRVKKWKKVVTFQAVVHKYITCNSRNEREIKARNIIRRVIQRYLYRRKIQFHVDKRQKRRIQRKKVIINRCIYKHVIWMREKRELVKRRQAALLIERSYIKYRIRQSEIVRKLGAEVEALREEIQQQKQDIILNTTTTNHINKGRVDTHEGMNHHGNSSNNRKKKDVSEAALRIQKTFRGHVLRKQIVNNNGNKLKRRGGGYEVMLIYI